MATKAKTTPKVNPEIGDSGVQIMNGIITGEEYNFNLMGRRALQTWDEMRRSDATVKMSLKVVKEPVKALPWYIQPASKDDKDIEVAEYVDGVLFSALRWKATLGEILTHIDFGFSVFEKVLQVAEIKGVQRISLKKLAFRKQSSIAKWEAGPNTPGITQTGAGGTGIPIELDRLVVFTHEQEGDNYEGISILRPAYKHWYYKDKLYQIDAIGHERQSLGVVKIKHPKDANPAHIESAKNAARALRANEEASITEPQGFDINFMDMKAGSLKDTEPSINHHDRQIVVNVLAQFMSLGSTSGSGSRAVGEPQLKIFEQSIRSLAEYIADTINRYLIKDLVDLNFNVTEYPTLTIGDGDEKSLEALAKAFKDLIEAGVVTPTEEDESYMRGRLGLPERPDDEVEDEDDTKSIKPKKTTDKAPDELEEEEEVKKASVVDRARAALSKLRASIYDRSKRKD